MAQFHSGNIAVKVILVLGIVVYAGILGFVVPVICGHCMAYGISCPSYCDTAQTLVNNPLPLIVAFVLIGVVVELLVRRIRGHREREEEDKEGTTWHYHPPPERKPKTGVGSKAWEAKREREIRELREKERKKAAEST